MNPGPEALLRLTLDHMSSPQTHVLGLHTGFITGPGLRLALSHTLTQHGTSTPLPEPERHGFTPKGGYSDVSAGS
jgi:hypothetical protein